MERVYQGQLYHLCIDLRISTTRKVHSSCLEIYRWRWKGRINFNSTFMKCSKVKNAFTFVPLCHSRFLLCLRKTSMGCQSPQAWQGPSASKVYACDFVRNHARYWSLKARQQMTINLGSIGRSHEQFPHTAKCFQALCLRIVHNLGQLQYLNHQIINRVTRICNHRSIWHEAILRSTTSHTWFHQLLKNEQWNVLELVPNRVIYAHMVSSHMASITLHFNRCHHSQRVQSQDSRLYSNIAGSRTCLQHCEIIMSTCAGTANDHFRIVMRLVTCHQMIPDTCLSRILFPVNHPIWIPWCKTEICRTLDIFQRTTLRGLSHRRKCQLYQLFHPIGGTRQIQRFSPLRRRRILMIARFMAYTRTRQQTSPRGDKSSTKFYQQICNFSYDTLDTLEGNL